jgi:hypothetical protein
MHTAPWGYRNTTDRQKTKETWETRKKEERKGKK